MASRGAGDSSKPTEGLGKIVVRDVGIELVVAEIDLGTDGSNPASVSIDDTATNSDTLGKTQLVGSLLAESSDTLTSAGVFSVLKEYLLAFVLALMHATDEAGFAWVAQKSKREMEELAHHLINATHALEIVLDKIIQSNSVIKVLLPAFDTAIHADWDVSLLADGAAEAAVLVTSGDVGESITEIVKLGPFKQLCRHIVLEPKNFGDLHFDAHFASNIFQKIVVSVVDELGLLDRSVVKPQDNVSIIAIAFEVRPSNGNRLVGIG